GEALHPEGESISLQPYPRAAESKMDPAAEAQIEWLQQVINALRGIRGEMNLAPKQKIPVMVTHASTSDRARLAANRAAIDFLSGVDSMGEHSDDAIPESAVALVGDMQL